MFSHTSNKRGAIHKLASHLKEGGYLIFGDPNRAGGFQNMLQRWILYRFTANSQQLASLAEELFAEDIDRSQAAVARTRKAIIYDRWVVPQQDDPSVSDVLQWFDELGLEFYSAWPRCLQPIWGDSLHHRARAEAANFPQIGLLSELVWMMQDRGDSSFIPQFLTGQSRLYEAVKSLTDYVGEIGPTSVLEADTIVGLLEEVRASGTSNPWAFVMHQFKSFSVEVENLVRQVERGELTAVKRAIRESKHMFRGAVGMRHVDFVGYKPKA